MTQTSAPCSIRVRSYRETVRDASRTFILPAVADVRIALKRAALTVIPKLEGWTLRVFTVERTTTGERVAAVLDRLARRELGNRDFAAALAATLDGALAVLAVAAKRPRARRRDWVTAPRRQALTVSEESRPGRSGSPRCRTCIPLRVTRAGWSGGRAERDAHLPAVMEQRERRHEELGAVARRILNRPALRHRTRET